ncbi:ycf3-interacting protein 1, chloroplastic isoform X2 [Rosa rugosa]|uniref:ycf3-interacting protein 1, chloroplastic isoform X2 n=1 Tax=Rosa rugosa TaxID=74645 RepID=UPI002B409CD8|nr:ycf3-interacting protein 1, chloroplastic isoform X2 [Rosa rugosa]
MMMTSSQMLQVAPLASHAYSSSSSSSSQTLPVWFNHCHCHPSRPQLTLRHRPRSTILLAGNPDRKLQVSSSPSSSWTTQQDQDDEEDEEDEDDDQEEEEESDPTPDDLEYISQIKRVLELLKNNRDMIFNEVKLTIAIEDIREVERRRLLGIEDPDAPTREELAAVLEEVQIKPAKKKPGKSLYARVTDTGIDLKEAAKRLNIDWDTAAEIDDADVKDESDVPSVVGYGALYLVTLFPVIIGVSVVLILFYNSLQ